MMIVIVLIAMTPPKTIIRILILYKYKQVNE